MLFYLTVIFCCQLAGELITQGLHIPIPGPVAGMVLLFLFLLIRGNIPKNLTITADGLLNHLSLLFVPAGVGITLHFRLVGDEWLQISVALIVSTVLTIAVTALMMSWLSQRTMAIDEAEKKSNPK
ncbi:MAG: CidA/LrgA family protein [Rhodospirillales bacterium]